MSEFVMLDLSAPTYVTMPPSLTVRDAEHVHARLLEAVRDRSSVVIDCRAATDIDLSFIQLVISAHKSALANGKALTVVPPSDGRMTDILRRAGLIGTADRPPADALFWFHKEATGGEDRAHSR
jgi:anti-anti-sigma regulatory factor